MLGLKIKQVCWRLVFVNLKKSMIANLLHIFVNKSGLFIFYKTAFNFENNGVLPSATNPITAQYLANIEFKKYDTKRIRSSRPEVFYQKGLLRNFTKFTGKHQCQSLFFNKVEGVKSATLLKKILWHRCFSVNFTKLLRTLFFLQNTSGGCF